VHVLPLKEQASPVGSDCGQVVEVHVDEPSLDHVVEERIHVVHACVLQSRPAAGLPSGLLTESYGSGSQHEDGHVTVRVWVPPPQETEHAPQLPVDHVPL